MGDFAILANITPTTWALITAGWIIPGQFKNDRFCTGWRYVV